MSNFNFAGTSPIPFVAGGTIEQYRAVVMDSTAHQVVAGSAIAGVAIGASLTSASSGDQISIQTMGVAKLTASDAITVGAEVMVTASGAGKVSIAAGATARSIGVALSAAGANGDVIDVLLATPALAGPANT